MRFAGRVVLGTILVLLFAILTLVWVSQRGLRGDVEREIAHALLAEARLVARVLPADPAEWSRAAADYAAATGHRVTLISREGRVVAESALRPESSERMESHAERPEVVAALRDGQGIAIRTSASIDRAMLYVAVPGGPGGPAVVRVAAPLDQVDAAARGAGAVVL
ncbi:MAG: hypothetical protein ACREMH_07490, partial [Gemmatimonadales bacterium]